MQATRWHLQKHLRFQKNIVNFDGKKNSNEQKNIQRFFILFLIFEIKI